MYLQRPADEEVHKTLLRGQACHVVGPPQSGKTSLRRRTEEQLRQRGVLCASVALATLCSPGISKEQWHTALLHQIGEALGLSAPSGGEDLKPQQRWLRYFRDEVLPGCNKKSVVVFLDGIEVLRGSEFSDDLFQCVRTLHDARGESPALKGLTFCLLGVLMPWEVMKHPESAPFDHSRGITLYDFTREELRAIEGELPRQKGQNRRLLVDEIYGWTRGHPALTMMLVDALRESESLPEGVVTELVRERFLGAGRNEDAGMVQIERRFHRLSAIPPADKEAALLLYRRLVEGEKVPAASGDVAQIELRLAGLAVPEKATKEQVLRVRTQILRQTFTISWVDDKLYGIRLVAKSLRPQKEQKLLSGAELQHAQRWATAQSDLSESERAFLFASQSDARRIWQRTMYMLGSLMGLLGIAFGIRACFERPVLVLPAPTEPGAALTQVEPPRPVAEPLFFDLRSPADLAAPEPIALAPEPTPKPEEPAAKPPVPKPEEPAAKPPVPKPEVAVKPPVPKPEVAVKPPVPKPEVATVKPPQPTPKPVQTPPKVAQVAPKPVAPVPTPAPQEPSPAKPLSRFAAAMEARPSPNHPPAVQPQPPPAAKPVVSTPKPTAAEKEARRIKDLGEVESLLRQGQRLAKLNRHDEAIDTFKHALSLSKDMLHRGPDNVREQANLLLSFHHMAEAAYEQNKWKNKPTGKHPECLAILRDADAAKARFQTDDPVGTPAEQAYLDRAQKSVSYLRQWICQQ